MFDKRGKLVLCFAKADQVRFPVDRFKSPLYVVPHSQAGSTSSPPILWSELGNLTESHQSQLVNKICAMHERDPI